jgi:hypothetical protein
MKKKKKNDWLTSFVRTDGLPYTLHCIALHCIALCYIVALMIHCIYIALRTYIALHCIDIPSERNVNSTACLLLNCYIGHVPQRFSVSVCFVFVCLFLVPFGSDEVRPSVLRFPSDCAIGHVLILLLHWINLMEISFECITQGFLCVCLFVFVCLFLVPVRPSVHLVHQDCAIGHV